MSAEKRKLGSSSNDYIELIKKSSSHWELILNRPDKFNAITSDMYERMIQIFDDAAKDEELVLLSITGKGKYYSAGTDLTDPAKSFMSANSDVDAVIEVGKNRIKKFIDGFINFPKILVAFINGPAIGVSVTTLGLCDGVYASSSSTFALPFTRTAPSAEGCSSYVFPNLMGSLHAKEILLFDRQLTAHEAQQRGLVTRVIDENIFEQEKEKICQQILSLPKGSLLAGKALIQGWHHDKLKLVNEKEVNTLKERWVTEEFAEAILKFMGGRRKSKL